MKSKKRPSSETKQSGVKRRKEDLVPKSLDHVSARFESAEELLYYQPPPWALTRVDSALEKHQQALGLADFQMDENKSGVQEYSGRGFERLCEPHRRLGFGQELGLREEADYNGLVEAWAQRTEFRMFVNHHSCYNSSYVPSRFGGLRGFGKMPVFTLVGKTPLGLVQDLFEDLKVDLSDFGSGEVRPTVSVSLKVWGFYPYLYVCWPPEICPELSVRAACAFVRRNLEERMAAGEIKEFDERAKVAAPWIVSVEVVDNLRNALGFRKQETGRCFKVTVVTPKLIRIVRQILCDGGLVLPNENVVPGLGNIAEASTKFLDRFVADFGISAGSGIRLRAGSYMMRTQYDSIRGRRTLCAIDLEVSQENVQADKEEEGFSDFNIVAWDLETISEGGVFSVREKDSILQASVVVTQRLGAPRGGKEAPTNNYVFTLSASAAVKGFRLFEYPVYNSLLWSAKLATRLLRKFQVHLKSSDFFKLLFRSASGASPGLVLAKRVWKKIDDFVEAVCTWLKCTMAGVGMMEWEVAGGHLAQLASGARPFLRQMHRYLVRCPRAFRAGAHQPPPSSSSSKDRTWLFVGLDPKVQSTERENRGAVCRGPLPETSAQNAELNAAALARNPLGSASHAAHWVWWDWAELRVPSDFSPTKHLGQGAGFPKSPPWDEQDPEMWRKVCSVAVRGGGATGALQAACDFMLSLCDDVSAALDGKGEGENAAMRFRRNSVCWKVALVKQEGRMLTDMADTFRRVGADVFFGYNTNGFDFRYFEARARAIGAHKALFWSHIGEVLQTRTRIGGSKQKGPIEETKVFVPGAASFDMLPYIRGLYKFPDYKLSTVLAAFGAGSKLDMNYDLIWVFFMNNMHSNAKLAQYCGYDSTQLCGLFKLNPLLSSMNMARVAKIMLESLLMGSMTDRSNGILLHYCKNLGFVRPYQQDLNRDSFEGALVLEPFVGYYGPVVTLDFRALYPSIICFYNICYTTTILEPQRELKKLVDFWFENEERNPKWVRRPGESGLGWFRRLVNCIGTTKQGERMVEHTLRHAVDHVTGRVVREEHIQADADHTAYWVSADVRVGVVPQLQRDITAARNSAKRERDKHPEGSYLYVLWDIIQNSYKLQGNSIYGSLKGYGLFLRIAAAAVTACGRRITGTLRDLVKVLYPHFLVIYGDTDSVMILLRNVSMTHESLYQHGRDMEQKLNRYLALMVPLGSEGLPSPRDFEPEAAKQQIRDCLIVLEFEKVALKFMMVAAKMYAANVLMVHKGGLIPKGVKIAGMGAAQKSTCSFVKELQVSVLDVLMKGTGDRRQAAISFARNETAKMLLGEKPPESLIFTMRMGDPKAGVQPSTGTRLGARLGKSIGSRFPAACYGSVKTYRKDGKSKAVPKSDTFDDPLLMHRKGVLPNPKQTFLDKVVNPITSILYTILVLENGEPLPPPANKEDAESRRAVFVARAKKLLWEHFPCDGCSRLIGIEEVLPLTARAGAPFLVVEEKTRTRSQAKSDGKAGSQSTTDGGATPWRRTQDRHIPNATPDSVGAPPPPLRKGGMKQQTLSSMFGKARQQPRKRPRLAQPARGAPTRSDTHEARARRVALPRVRGRLVRRHSLGACSSSEVERLYLGEPLAADARPARFVIRATPDRGEYLHVCRKCSQNLMRDWPDDPDVFPMIKRRQIDTRGVHRVFGSKRNTRCVACRQFSKVLVRGFCESRDCWTQFPGYKRALRKTLVECKTELDDRRAQCETCHSLTGIDPATCVTSSCKNIISRDLVAARMESLCAIKGRTID